MKRTLSPRLVPVAVAGGLLAVALICWFALIAPQRSKASSLAKEIVSVQSEISQRRIASRTESTNETVRYADVFRLSRAMPARAAMPEILLELNGVAGDTGVALSTVTPHEVVIGPSFQELPIDLTVEGTYFAMSDFLYRLRNLVAVRKGELTATGRLFRIDTMSFSEGRKGLPQIQASMTLSAFVYGGPPAAAVLPTETPVATGETSTEPTTPPPPPAPTGATAAGITP